MAKKTTYYDKREQTSNKTFHSPQAYGKLVEIPMDGKMTAISIISLILNVVLTALAIYAALSTGTIAALADTGYASSLIYLVFPLVTWLIAIGFRVICKTVPFDMWRLPANVKEGVKLCQGTLLKMATLLIELFTVICFIYMVAILYFGKSPNVFVLLAWIAAVVISIIILGRKALDLVKAEEEKKKAARAAKKARLAAKDAKAAEKAKEKSAKEAKEIETKVENEAKEASKNESQ